MQLTGEFGMTKLAAECPQCRLDSVYCGMIPTKIKSLSNKEVLFCQSCKFVTTVDEYKAQLFHT